MKSVQAFVPNGQPVDEQHRHILQSRLRTELIERHNEVGGVVIRGCGGMIQLTELLKAGCLAVTYVASEIIGNVLCRDGKSGVFNPGGVCVAVAAAADAEDLRGSVNHAVHSLKSIHSGYGERHAARI